jgi:hypothetical protein
LRGDRPCRDLVSHRRGQRGAEGLSASVSAALLTVSPLESEPWDRGRPARSVMPWLCYAAEQLWRLASCARAGRPRSQDAGGKRNLTGRVA